ncbi:MAG TPA: hypothetical protein VG819_15335 [Rhizomicrobium sp.]|jgi:hypothetical protein|nr:hypothetical protein [Rhizomicrobium sp.]
MAAGLLAICVLLPAGAQAGRRDEVLSAMDHCATIADKDQRLACFDQLSSQVKAALAEAPMAGPPTLEQQKSWFGFDLGDIFGGTAPSRQTTPEQFGSENLPAPPPKEGEPPPPEPLESITADVTEYAYTPVGKFVVFLEGGQVWRQLEADSGRANFRRSGNTVTISRGLIGSYNMQINGSNAVFKVKRVK